MPKDNIINMSEKTGNGTLRTPEQALKEALGFIGKEGAFKNGKKLLIIALDEVDGDYNVSWLQAGMKMSQCVSLCEITKILFAAEMNYINS